MTTKYKNVKVGTKTYRQVMKKIGECMDNGGYVDFNHSMKFTQNLDGHRVRTDYVDAVLTWK